MVSSGTIRRPRQEKPQLGYYLSLQLVEEVGHSHHHLSLQLSLYPPYPQESPMNEKVTAFPFQLTADGEVEVVACLHHFHDPSFWMEAEDELWVSSHRSS
jgi:beta-glucosidase/6-phospho-beta-glucosidase/beta-galactosidase